MIRKKCIKLLILNYAAVGRNLAGSSITMTKFLLYSKKFKKKKKKREKEIDLSR